jgi:hypothetical protein
MKVEGVDYTPGGIRDLRKKLIEYRDESMKQWPGAIPFTVDMSHTIALMEHFAALLEELAGEKL